jgi:hypothetical protein
MGQSVYRQTQKLPGLNSLFRAMAQVPHDTRIKIKCLMALAFVPVEYIYEYFCLLIHQFNPDEEVTSQSFLSFKLFFYFLLELTRYFAKNWIGCKRIWDSEPVPLEDDDVLFNYGVIDQALREWIAQKNYQNRRATFRVEIWNMCER